MENELAYKERLVGFVKDTFAFLGNLAKEKDANRPIYFNNFNKELHKAWIEFEKDFDIEDATNKINELSENDLKLHGLYGDQLDLKLSLVEFLGKQFNSVTKNWKSKLTVSMRKILKALLNAINNLLDSILAATGIKDSIKELKKAIETILDIDDIVGDENS